MSRRDGEMWQEVARLLRRRPGWSVQAAPSPGAPTFWCYRSGPDVELSVTVDGGAIKVCRVDTDEEAALATASDLATWLTEHRRGALQDRKSGIADRLKSGRLFRWE